MVAHSKKRVSRISMGSAKPSHLSLKSKSLSKESLASFNSKLSLSGVIREASPVSWKQLIKRSPWLELLYDHQRKGTEAIVSTDGFAALFAQRSGKTWVTGAVLEVEKYECHDVLLIGPLTNLKSTWVKFLTEKLPWYSVHLDLPSYLQHQKEFVKAWGMRDHCILLLNPEALTPLVKKLQRVKWDRMVWDEAQRLKNRNSRSSKDAMLLARSARKRLALTGTPMDLDPKDLWAIMRFVEVDCFGKNWGDFESEYLVKPNIDIHKARGIIEKRKMMLAYQIAKRKAPMREDMIDQFAELIAPNALRISKEDAGIEPAKVHVVRFNLEPDEDKLYRQMEKSMLVKVKGKVIKAPLKITQMGKLQQITGGHLKDEDGETHLVTTTKRRVLRRHILDHVEPGTPFVIFCKFVWEVHMLYRLVDRLGYGKGAMLWGKVKDIKTDPRRTRMLTDFQDGKLDWMICQQRTGGVGVDLYRARHFYVYSLGHSYIDYDQMLSRGDFLQQDKPANFFLLAVRSSIDTDIISAVKDKKTITERFYDRLV